MKIATVLESSEPVSMMRRQRGIISVESKKWMTVLLSFCCRKVYYEKKFVGERNEILTLTRAPMTPREVRRRYSNGRVLDAVFKKG